MMFTLLVECLWENDMALVVDTVIQQYVEDNDRCQAVDLCNELMKLNFTKRDSQLFIQRAIENKVINVNSDWTLSYGKS